MVMPFGKFKGHSVSSLPDDYLEWLGSIDLRQPLWTAVTAELHRRRIAEPPRPAQPPLQMAQRIVTAGFRACAKECHPDAGGDHGDMQRLNAAHTWLKEQLMVLR